MKKMIEMATKMRVWLILAVAVLSISSCLKDDNNYSVQAAGVALINASPGSGALDFISDGRVNDLRTKFAYDTVISYSGAYPGYRLFGVSPQGSRELLGSQQFSLEPGGAYSLFVTDTLSEIKLVMLKDSLSSQDSTKATIRFANMSADAPKLSLELSGSGSLKLSDIAYSKATAFESVAPGEGYTLKLIDNDTKKTLVTKSKVTLKKGLIYTVWAKGVFASTDSKMKLGLGLMEN